MYAGPYKLEELKKNPPPTKTKLYILHEYAVVKYFLCD